MKKALFISIATISVFSACSSDAGKKNEEKPVKVEAYYPTKLQGNDIFVSGVISASQTAVISTRMMGFVDKIYVKQGDRVKAGQLLMVINSDDLKAKKAQAEAMVTEASAATANAQRDYERFKVLHSQKSVSDKELENMELNKTSMESKLQMARQGLNEVNAMLAYTYIRAPFSGVVTQKMIDVGSTANPGMPLLSMEQAGDLNVQASVPETYVRYVQVGNPVQIEVRSQNKRLEGTVAELSPSASLTGGQYGMKIAIKDKDKETLKAGMYAGVHIPVEEGIDGGSKITVDKSSVIKREQLTGVYVVNPAEEAVLRWVRLGKEVGTQVEVLSGLNEKEKVIRQADGKLYNGKKVTQTK